MSFWDKMRSSFAFKVNKRTIKENQIAEEVRASLNAYENIWVDGFVDPEQVQNYKSYYHSLYSMISKKVDGFLFTFGFVYKSFKCTLTIVHLKLKCMVMVAKLLTLCFHFSANFVAPCNKAAYTLIGFVNITRHSTDTNVFTMNKIMLLN